MNVVTNYRHSKDYRNTLPKQGSRFPLSPIVKPFSLLQVDSSWLKRENLPLPSKPTLLLHDSKSRPPTHRRKIFVQYEPEFIHGMRSYLLQNASYYDYILTYDHVVLAQCRNAIHYVCADSWVPLSDYTTINVQQKQFKLSALFTRVPYQGEGHLFREVIYQRQKELAMPRVFYRSVRRGKLEDIDNNPLFSSKTSKIDLFRLFQFSLVIENSKQPNYFTEKIVDCLITKTIPVYWGCPNIDHFFDTTGWIVLKTTTFEELQEKLEGLTPDHYSKYTDIIEKNFQSALKFSNHYVNLKRGLLSIPNY